VGVPCEGKYREVLNTDDPAYGGNGILNTAVCDTLEHLTNEKSLEDKFFDIYAERAGETYEK